MHRVREFHIAVFSAAFAAALLTGVAIGATASNGESKQNVTTVIRSLPDVSEGDLPSAEADPVAAPAGPASGEEINWNVLAGGGQISGTSASFILGSSLGQTAVGMGSSSTKAVNHGFWQNFTAGGVQCVPGDADASGNSDIDDVVYLITYIFGGGPPPVPDACCGDANGSGNVDIDDAVYLIAYIFSGGPPPVAAC
jgi:hypothetical protein